MTKVRKQRRKKRFRANVNRKRLRNKLQKVPKIECKEIEGSWESKRSIRTNMKDMGLSYDPNEALKITSTKRKLSKAAKNSVQDVEVDGEEAEETPTAPKMVKIHVANALEAEAKAPRQRLFRLPKNQVQFVTYLMDKYGDDYKAMARDRKNYYQMTWCQIRAKINTFKGIPEQYAEYLVKSGEIVLDDPTPLEETRKKIGEENAKKYSAPKIRKPPKEAKPLWDVEDVEDDEFGINTDKVLGCEAIDGDNTSSKDKLKKLKLFSDDESEEEETPKNKVKVAKKKLVSTKDNDKTTGAVATSKETHANSDLLKPHKNNSKDLAKTIKKQRSLLANQKSQSSDSDSDDEALDGDDDADGFLNLSDMSDEELSEDDVLDDGEFVTDSNDDSD